MAKELKAITKEGEVYEIGDVVVEESEEVTSVSKKTWTLKEIDRQVAFMQAKIAELTALRVDVEKEAKKVILAVPE